MSEYMYVIHLLACAIQGSVPEEKPEGISWERIFSLAKFHSVESTVYQTVQKLQLPPDKELLSRWEDYFDRAVIQDTWQMTELAHIVCRFSDEKIKMILLKGSVLKNLYDAGCLRSMSDLDILIEESKAKDAEKVMKELGYQCRSVFDHHDTYVKEPFVAVEIHRTLMPQSSKEYYSYFLDVWEKAHYDEKKPYLYRLSLEDMYIFNTAHFAKHYFKSGSGLRSVMDIYVFLRKYKDELDYHYLEKELRKINLWNFAMTMERLAVCWFEGLKMDQKLQDITEYIAVSGTYGVRTSKVRNDLVNGHGDGKSLRRSKIKYLCRRVIPNYPFMCSRYPCLKKAPVLLPCFWIVRMIQILLKQDKFRAEMKALEEMDEAKVRKQRNCMDFN